MQDGCISNDHLILYLSKELSEKGVEQVEKHLNICTICRQRLLAATEQPENEEKFTAPPNWLVSKVAKIPSESGKASSSSRFSKMGMAAAAAVAFVALGITLFLSERNSSPSNGFRNGVSVSAQAPLLSAPEVQANTIEFKWSEAPSAESYQFTILNETGDIVFQKALQKNSLVLSRNEISFDSEKPYFWFVTAKDSRAVTVDSKIQKFHPNKKYP